MDRDAYLEQRRRKDREKLNRKAAADLRAKAKACARDYAARLKASS